MGANTPATNPQAEINPSDLTSPFMTKPRRSSTTAATLALSDSDFSSSTASTATFRAGFKRVRFHNNNNNQNDGSPVTVTIHSYPQAAFNAERPSDLFLSSQEQSQLSRDTKKHAARTWGGDASTSVLHDIHHCPVQERIDRMLQLPLEARGLEKELCPTFKQRSLELQDGVVETVLEHQAQLRLQQRDNNNGGKPKKNADKIIAKAAMEGSHSARCMARVLGLADQQQAREIAQEKVLEDKPRPKRRNLRRLRSKSDSCLGNSMVKQQQGDATISQQQEPTKRQSDGHRGSQKTHERQQPKSQKPKSSRSLSPLRLSKTVLKLGKRVGGSLRGSLPISSPLHASSSALHVGNTNDLLEEE